MACDFSKLYHQTDSVIVDAVVWNFFKESAVSNFREMSYYCIRLIPPNCTTKQTPPSSLLLFSATFWRNRWQFIFLQTFPERYNNVLTVNTFNIIQLGSEIIGVLSSAEALIPNIKTLVCRCKHSPLSLTYCSQNSLLILTHNPRLLPFIMLIQMTVIVSDVIVQKTEVLP